ncbi:hypothetical protein LTS01_023588 [Friedmanniomyces endolithicus]|nr:hypothetical protein LTS01_023588 [Friedmanniomyces endolithicus]
MPVNNSATNPDPQQYPMPLLHPTQSAPEPPRPSMVSAASASQIPQTYDEQLTNRTSKTSKMRKMSNGVNSWVKKHPVIATSVAISGAVVVEAAGLVVGVDAVKDAALINRGVNKFQARRKASQIAQKQPDTMAHQNFASGPQQQALQQQNLQQQNLQQQAAFQQQQSAQQQTTLQQQQAYQQQLYQQQLLYQQQTYANGQTPVYLQQQYPAYQQQYPAYQQPPPQYYQQPPVYQDNSINMVDSGGVDPLTMMALSDPGLIDPTATQQVNMNVQDISVNSQQTTVDSTQNVIDPSQLGGASLPTTPDGLQDGSAYVNPPLTPPLSSTDGTGDWGNMANGSDGGDDDGGCDDDEDDDY